MKNNITRLFIILNNIAASLLLGYLFSVSVILFKRMDLTYLINFGIGFLLKFVSNKMVNHFSDVDSIKRDKLTKSIFSELWTIVISTILLYVLLAALSLAYLLFHIQGKQLFILNTAKVSLIIFTSISYLFAFWMGALWVYDIKNKTKTAFSRLSPILCIFSSLIFISQLAMLLFG